MTDTGLNKDQIDAALDSSAESQTGAPAQINDSDLAALADFERETMGNLPGVLNAMTGFDYKLQTIEYAKTNPGELPSLLSNELMFCVPITVGEAIKHYLILDMTFAKAVAHSLTGAEEREDDALTEMEMSAISEVISQVNGTYLTNLSSVLKMPVTGEAVVTTDVGSVAGEIDDTAMIANIYMEQASGESILVRHLIPGMLANMVLKRIASTQDQAPPTEPAAAKPKPQPATLPVSSGSMVSPSTEFSPATFSQLTATETQAETRNLDILLDVPLQVAVELGKTQIPIKKILEYGQGSLITLDKLAGEPIDLLINGEYFAKGEVVVIDENFGVRITSILSPAERLAQLS